MRVRFNKDAQQYLIDSKIYIEKPEEYINKWKTLFNNSGELHIEIGMGKGDFIVQIAKLNPNINYIGIERNISILAKACKKIEKENLTNIRLLSIDAVDLEKVFGNGEVDKMYLNFSDPWPKKKHAKRRLTYRTFLQIYDNILKSGSEIEFKTDNQSLFESTLLEVANTKHEIIYVSLDLHNTNEFNIQTEYEEKFSKNGNRICKLIWKK